MFNYAAIDKTPTVSQIKQIIRYMKQDKENNYNFACMMQMSRPKPDLIKLDLNNAHFGTTYDIRFNKEGDIESFECTGKWMS